MTTKPYTYVTDLPLVQLRNRQHLIQLLNALHQDAINGKATYLWFRTEEGVDETIRATVTKSNSVNFSVNGMRTSRDAILRRAGY